MKNNSNNNKVQKESHYRSIIKGLLVWRIIGTLDTYVAFFL
ncbi:MAG: hypothetical protein R2777_07135 [Chitinophagales bacterium]